MANKKITKKTVASKPITSNKAIKEVKRDLAKTSSTTLKNLDNLKSTLEFSLSTSTKKSKPKKTTKKVVKKSTPIKKDKISRKELTVIKTKLDKQVAKQRLTSQIELKNITAATKDAKKSIKQSKKIDVIKDIDKKDTIITLEKKTSKVVDMKSNLVLYLKNLNVSFPKRKKLIDVIRGVDLKVKKAEIVGLVGESGSGKSVTTKALLDINFGAITTSDKAILDGIDLNKLRDFNQVRGSKIGYIPQDPMTSLNPTRQIWKQINDVLVIHRRDLKTKSDRIDYMVSLLKKFGIRNAAQLIYQYPHSLSGGMRQRVVIAMVVSAQPKLIIADEPTTALDPTVQASVLELLNKIRRDYNISIIFISHNISVVAKFVDYIYIMYAGRVVERGTKKDIFTNPKHPYTWALISSLPKEGSSRKLLTIPGTPPNMEFLPTGDPFASRNKYAIELDYRLEPPLFKVNSRHFAATWLLHPSAPKIPLPKDVKDRVKLFKKVWNVK